MASHHSIEPSPFLRNDQQEKDRIYASIYARIRAARPVQMGGVFNSGTTGTSSSSSQGSGRKRQERVRPDLGERQKLARKVSDPAQIVKHLNEQRGTKHTEHKPVAEAHHGNHPVCPH